MTPPVTARDKQEGPCAEDRCDWFPWSLLHACAHCGKAFCEDHVHPEDHGCVEAER